MRKLDLSRLKTTEPVSSDVLSFFSSTLYYANSSTSGVVRIVDSTSNTSPALAASANSVKAAYDLATTAMASGGATAYTNAVSYADTKAATAYSNATSVAATDASTKAATAYSNATSVAATDASTKAATAYSNAVSVAAIDASTKAATAYSNAASYADTKASTSYSNATSYADTKAATAYSNATSYADTRAATAYSNAVSVASTDASTKAATAYSNATSYAATIAATAYSNAVSVASTDASTKAAAAYSNATTYAATIAATAYSNAVAYAASNTYVNAQDALKANLSGATFTGAVGVSNTLSSGNTTINGFANITGSLTVGGVTTIAGNLVVNGTTLTVNTSQINTTDSIIYLADGNESSDSIDIGFAGHYNTGAGANGHTGLIRSAVTKKYYLFQNYQPEFFANNNVDVANTGTGIQMADIVVGNLVANSTLTSTGNATFSNTISVTGNATFSNTTAHVGAATFSNTIAVTGNATFSNSLSSANLTTTTNSATFGTTLFVVANGNVGVQNSTPSAPLVVGQGIGSFTNPLAQFGGNANSWIQINGQNANNGNNASTDLVLGRSDANDIFGYIDLGINSNTYSQAAYGIMTPNSGYLFTNSGDLFIGTQTVHNITLFTGNTTTSAQTITMVANGNLGIGNSAPANKLSVNGTMYVFGNATFSNTTAYVGAATFSNTIVVTGNATFSNTVASPGHASGWLVAGNTSVATPIRNMTVYNGEISVVGANTTVPVGFINVSDASGNLGSNSSLIIRGLASNGSVPATLANVQLIAANVFITGDVYTNYSDSRLKIKLGDIEDALDIIDSIETMYYEPNQLALDLGATTGRRVGVSAQSVQLRASEAVGTSPMGNQYLTVQYERLVPFLIAAVKQLRAQVKELRGQK